MTLKMQSIKRIGITAAAGSFLFLFGVAVGQGKVKFGPDSSFSSTVNKQLPADLSYDGVEKIYDSLRANYDGELDQTKLQDGLKDGLARATGDPYTEFLNVSDAQEFDQELSGTFTGIGAELSKDTETNTIIIVSPISGFPAEKAGLKPRDVIAEIDGKSAYDLTVTEAVSKIRGEAGTVVKLRVIRDGSQDLTFEITREQITIPSVTTKELENGTIGYIKIARFSDDTTALVRSAAAGFAGKKVKGVILDVRGDPGGLLDAAVDVSSLWLDKKTVLTERRGGEVIRTFTSKGTPLLKGIPTVVLINGGSASASEIVAGALRDNEAATLIGEKTFGKGSVQQLVRFNDKSLLKVTIARWFTPAGKNIDQEGIAPDQEVKISDDDLKNGRDPQLDAAQAALKN